MDPIQIKGFLHFRDNLGDGTQSAVVFNSCSGNCPGFCRDFRPLREHPFGEDTLESREYTPEELIAYLKEEKTLCYTKSLGITFLGKEPLNHPFFCQKVACGIRDLGMKLRIMTCASVSPTAFDLLFGLVDLFVVNYFSPIPNFIPYPEYDHGLVTENIRYLDRKGFSYRLRIPVLNGVNTTAEIPLAEFAASLKNVKSVILDFTNSGLSEDEIFLYRKAFLKRGVLLY